MCRSSRSRRNQSTGAALPACRGAWSPVPVTRWGGVGVRAGGLWPGMPWLRDDGPSHLTVLDNTAGSVLAQRTTTTLRRTTPRTAAWLDSKCQTSAAACAVQRKSNRALAADESSVWQEARVASARPSMTGLGLSAMGVPISIAIAAQPVPPSRQQQWTSRYRKASPGA